MSFDTTQYFLEWLWILFVAPIVFTYQKIYSLRKEISELKTVQEYKKADLDYVKQKLDTVSSQLDRLNGAMDEHLRKNDGD